MIRHALRGRAGRALVAAGVTVSIIVPCIPTQQRTASPASASSRPRSRPTIRSSPTSCRCRRCPASVRRHATTSPATRETDFADRRVEAHHRHFGIGFGATYQAICARRRRTPVGLRQPRGERQVPVLHERRARDHRVGRRRLGHRRQRHEARRRRVVQHHHADDVLRQGLRRPARRHALLRPFALTGIAGRRHSDPQCDDHSSTTKVTTSVEQHPHALAVGLRAGVQPAVPAVVREGRGARRRRSTA